ncbi:MAG: transcriptional repressor NrdR, partial [Treponema sp.]|nr:transcriptional repressor NrdR [Treponema sp.]
FDKAKLEKGIERALEKRPFSQIQVEQLVTDIEDAAIRHGREDREIGTADLGEIVLQKLYEADKVAYIRFASVYKHFENIEEFLKEIKNIEGKK